MSNFSNAQRALPEITVGGFQTVALSRQQLADVMVTDCLEARLRGKSWLPKLVFSSNGQGIALAGRDSRFYEAMRAADIIHADGMPVVFASKFAKPRLPERISTTDFFHDAARASEPHGLKFFLLGAREEQNAAAALTAAQLYPGVEIVGRHHGYFSPSEDDAICRRVRESGADVLWVALGKPRQEYWCVRNQHQLGGIGWLKTCGGLFSFLAGDAPRAPEWMQSAGLEWLYRTVDDPKRLMWRYLKTNPYAFYRLLRHTERTSSR